MIGFKREERYIVIKISKLGEDEEGREEIFRAARFGEAYVDAVVVEKDWPEYEPVWKMIEDRVTGRPVEAHNNCAGKAREREELIDSLQSRLAKATAIIDYLWLHTELDAIAKSEIDKFYGGSTDAEKAVRAEMVRVSNEPAAEGL